jgi:hypothetical protein
MAESRTLIRVFVASPGDVGEERALMEDLVREFNLTWGDTLKVQLELIKWETHSRPSFGVDAQDVINQQIGDSYDIFLGIMWGRFGTPTGRAESGTEEEFERAYRRLNESPNSVQILFYFKDTPIQPSKIDANQLSKVQQFKARIGAEYGGLYHGFETSEEFHTKARIHLSKAVQELLQRISSGSSHSQFKEVLPDIDAETSTIHADSSDPLANLSAVQDDDADEGLLELDERASVAMNSINVIIGSFSAATVELGERIEQRSAELDRIAVSKPTNLTLKVKRVANSAASDMERYVEQIAAGIPDFQRDHSAAMEGFSKIAVISSLEFAENEGNIRQALEQVKLYVSTMNSTVSKVAGFRDSMASVPRMTTNFGRSRKRAVAVTDDLLVQLRAASRQTDEVRKLLEDLLEQRALVTTLEEAPVAQETTLLSEPALAEDWNRPEEDAAWAHLQRDKSS